MESSAQPKLFTGSLSQSVKLFAVVSLVLLLLIDNLKYAPLNQFFQPVLNRTIYPLGLGQTWNMFVGNQDFTVAIREQQVYARGGVHYVYSAMGQKPYIWPDKQRNLDWGLVEVDHTGVYRSSYLRYVCQHQAGLKRITLQVAFLLVPTPATPESDPFVDTPVYRSLTTVRCQA